MQGLAGQKTIVKFLFLLAFAYIFLVCQTQHAIAATQLPVSVQNVGTTTFKVSIDTSSLETAPFQSFWWTTNSEYNTVASSSTYKCYPQIELVSSFASTTFEILDTSVSHAGNTSFGSAPCDTSGYYYVVFKTPSDGFNYYGAYYWDASTTIPLAATSTLFGTSTCVGGNTQICGFRPENDTATTGPSVYFDLEYRISPDDVGDVTGVKVTMENIDQNILIFGILSSQSFMIVDENREESGTFFSATNTPLADGNYRVEVCLERSYFGGWLLNPLSPLNLCESHQFIVGTSTFIGNISQNLFRDTQDFYQGLTATSSEALARTCNPIGDFDIRQCLAYLFVPDAAAMHETIGNLREGILTRLPWGYMTRLVAIVNSSATSSLPVIVAEFQIAEGETETLTFDISDMLAGGAAAVDSIHDPINGMTFRDVFENMIRLTVALGVLFTIVWDVASMGNHPQEPADNRRRRV